MTKYAYFNPTAPSPSPVLGIYDSTLLAAGATPPPAGNLLVLTDAQVASLSSGSWAIAAGALVAYTPPAPPPPDTRAAAQTALDKSDITMLRVAEAVSLGLTTWTTADVVVWADYRRTLRAHVSGGPTTAPLPVAPAYPAGT